jgi:hypothetical protein
MCEQADRRFKETAKIVIFRMRRSLPAFIMDVFNRDGPEVSLSASPE